VSTALEPSHSFSHARYTHALPLTQVRATLAGRGLRLLAFAADAGWPATVRLLLDLLTSLPLVAGSDKARGLTASALPAAAARCSNRSATHSAALVPLSLADILASTLPPSPRSSDKGKAAQEPPQDLDDMTPRGAGSSGNGLTPLHRAARSGSNATLRELLAAASASGLRVDLAAPVGGAKAPAGPAGEGPAAPAARGGGATPATRLSPLHYVALHCGGSGRGGAHASHEGMSVAGRDGDCSGGGGYCTAEDSTAAAGQATGGHGCHTGRPCAGGGGVSSGCPLMVQLALRSAPAAPLQWFTARGAGGVTPAELAARVGGARGAAANAAARAMVVALAALPAA
jgi:hypothetical protein